MARVYLDGAFQATVDTYSPTEIQAAVYTATTLAAASHTLTIEVTGQGNAAATGSLIYVDAFDIQSRFEDTDPTITYSGSWTPDTTRAWSGTSLNTGTGTAARSATAGSHAEFTLTGTSVSWIGFRAPGPEWPMSPWTEARSRGSTCIPRLKSSRRPCSPRPASRRARTR